MHVMYICLIVTIVKALCKQYIKHFSYQDLLNIFDKLLPDELNDSFKVITKKKKKKKKMSSKLLGCLHYRLNKVVQKVS